MMHGIDWTLKYDEPEVENVARRCSPSGTFLTEDHHILMLHERPYTLGPTSYVLSYG